jgi:hypothetical protein
VYYSDFEGYFTPYELSMKIPLKNIQIEDVRLVNSDPFRISYYHIEQRARGYFEITTYQDKNYFDVKPPSNYEFRGEIFFEPSGNYVRIPDPDFHGCDFYYYIKLDRR